MPVSNHYGSILSGLMGRLEPGRLDYMTPDEAHAWLVERAGTDFGRDVRPWVEWMIKQGNLREDEFRIPGGSPSN
jgi:hypothetical protein